MRWLRAFSIVTLVITTLFPTNQFARAATVSNFSDSLSTIKESTAANHTLTFTINDSWDASETLTIDFPDNFGTTGFSNTEPEDFDITDDGVDKTITANGLCAANEIDITSINNNTFTFTLCSGSASVASSSIIVIEIGTHATFGATGNDQIVNQTAVQNDTDPTVTLGGTFGGSGTLALEIVADNDATVSVAVLPRISCAFNGLTVTFPDATGVIITAATNTTVTAGTNAPNGLNISVYDNGNGTNPGLYKGSAPTYLIGSANSSFADTATLSNNVDGFGIQGAATQGDPGSATLSIAARYNQTGNTVGGLEVGAGASQQLASTTGPINNGIVTVTHKMAVSNLAPSGAYSDTVTYVCTGVF